MTDSLHQMKAVASLQQRSKGGQLPDADYFKELEELLVPAQVLPVLVLLEEAS